MADSDKTLQVLIEVLTRQVGPDKAAEILKATEQATISTTTATTELGEATEKTAGHTKLLNHEGLEMRRLFSELDRILPGLGEATRAIFHPSMLSGMMAAVAGVVAGFEIWQHRVEALQKSFGSLELPDISGDYLARVNAGAEAWEKYNTAVAQSKAAYDSADEVGKRRLQQIKDELEQTQKLLAARKAGELADLEAGRAGMSTEDFEARKRSIEERYGRAGIALEKDYDQKTLAEKNLLLGNLEAEADRKRKQAAAIRIADAETDARNAEALRANAEAARKDNEERQKWIERIQEMQSDRSAAVQGIYSFSQRYGFGATGSEAIEREQSAIENNKTIIAQSEARERAAREREEARRKREEYLKDAEKAQVEADRLRQTLPGEQKADADRRRNENLEQVFKLGRGGMEDSFNRGFDAFELLTHGHKLNADQTEAFNQMKFVIQAMGLNVTGLLQAIKASANVTAIHDQEIKLLRRVFDDLQRKNANTGP
jgi:hypothetical protein